METVRNIEKMMDDYGIYVDTNGGRMIQGINKITLEQNYQENTAYLKEQVQDAKEKGKKVELGELKEKLFYEFREMGHCTIDNVEKFTKKFGITQEQLSILPEHMKGSTVSLSHEEGITPSYWMAQAILVRGDFEQLKGQYSKTSQVVGLFDPEKAQQELTEELDKRIESTFDEIQEEERTEFLFDLEEALLETFFSGMGVTYEEIEVVEKDGYEYLDFGVSDNE